MKRLLGIFSAVLMMVGCGQNREEILKVYNWSTYIDESVIPEFEQWYEEQTGEKVHVIYQTFDVLENMLSKIEKGHEDYDVCCPSDYIIERMLQNNLLLPLDFDFGQTPNYVEQNVSPFIKGYFDKINGNGLNANDYAVGYMWGLTGFLYNAKYVTDEEASTWDILRNPKFAGKIFIKDAARDVCSQIIIHVNQDRLKAGEVTLDELMYDYSDETLAKVEDFMKEAAGYAAGWEADFGKEQMIKEQGWVNLNWSGDSMWAIDEAAEVGVDLRFACPKEGFTIFFDGWVIPKYARNIKAASYWINYMCRQDVALRNCSETGYVSVIGGKEMMDAFTDDKYPAVDASYFFGPEADSVHLNPVLYPDKADIARSTMEHDWGEATPKLVELWSRVKGDNASAFTYILIGTVAVFVCCLLALKFTKKNKKRSGKRSRK